MEILGLFIIIFFVSYFCYNVLSCQSSNDEVDEKLDQLEKAVDAFDNHKIEIQKAEDELVKFVQMKPSYTQHNYNTVKMLLMEYAGLKREYDVLVEDIISKQKEAKFSLDTKRHKHNVYWGGANDMAAMSYYKREERYQKIIYSIEQIKWNLIIVKKALAFCKEYEAYEA